MIESRARRYCLTLAIACFASAGILTAQSPTETPTSASVPGTEQGTQPQSIEILVDTQGVDFGPYLRDLSSRIRKSWSALLPPDAFNGARGMLTIEFAVQRDGHVTGMKLLTSSGNLSLDRAALGGITAAGPFPAFPVEFKGDSLVLRGRFLYNLDNSTLQTDEIPAAGSAPPIELVVEAQPIAGQSAEDTLKHGSSPFLLCVPGGAQTKVEGAEIPSDARGVDFRAYLDEGVLPLIRASWYRLVSKSGEKVGGEATIEFTILKDGSVTAVKLAEGAGHAALGDLAMNSVTKSGPFRPLPSDFTGPSVNVRTHFTYEPHARSAVDMAVPTYNHMCSPDETANGSVDCMTPPKAVYSPEPEFSEAARRKKFQGTVLVWAIVASDGTVKTACAAQPLGEGLDEKAVQAVRTWKFKPAIINGKPSDARIAVEVEFHLKDGEESASDNVKGSDRGAAAMSKTAAALQESRGDISSATDQAPTPAPIVRLGLGVSPPRVISSPPPETTERTGTAKYSGTVTLQLTVTTDGKPENIKVLKSLGPGLDKKAIDAVSKWRFEPATKNGSPVAVEIVVEVDFHLY